MVARKKSLLLATYGGVLVSGLISIALVTLTLTWQAHSALMANAADDALGVSRALAQELNEGSREISEILAHAPNPSPTATPQSDGAVLDIGGIDALIPGTRIFHLDRENVIRAVSRHGDRGAIGTRFDLTLESPPQNIRPQQTVSDMLLKFDSKVPFFRWHQNFLTQSQSPAGSLVLERELVELKSWCNGIRHGHPGTSVALLPYDRQYSHFDCSTDKDRQDLWRPFRSNEKLSPQTLDYRFRSDNYVVSLYQLDFLPILVATAVQVPSLTEALLGQLQVTSLVCLLFILGTTLLFFLLKKMIEENLEPFVLVAQGLTEDKKIPLTKGPPRNEFQAAFLAIHDMHDALETHYKKSSATSKMALALSSHFSANDILCKATELMCTHVKAESTWFIPEDAYGRATGQKGWLWKNHASKELTEADTQKILESHPAAPTSKLSIKLKNVTIGAFHALPPPSDGALFIEIAQALIHLVENHLTRNLEHLQEASDAVANKTAETLRNVHSMPVQLDSSGYRMATYYAPPVRHHGEFFYVLKAPTKDAVFFLVGGPSRDRTHIKITRDFMKSLPSLSWAIKGVVDGFEQNLTENPGATLLSPRQMAATLDYTLRKNAPLGDDLWDYFIGCYEPSSKTLTYCRQGREDPILLRRGGRIVDLERLSHNQTGPHATREHVKIERKLVFEADDLVLLLVGSEGSAHNTRHHLFSSILMRRISQMRPDMSSTALRDELKALHEYYYQGQPLDYDSCMICIEALESDAAPRHVPESTAS